MDKEISKERVLDLANVARLHVTDAEAEQFTRDLQQIDEHVELLNELDTTDVEPTIHVVDKVNVMRKDEPMEWFTQEAALKNAPDHKDGQFRVPSILSE